MKAKLVTPSQFPNIPVERLYISIPKYNTAMAISKGLCKHLKLNGQSSLQFCQDMDNLKDWYLRYSPLSPDAFKLSEKQSGKYRSIYVLNKSLCIMLKNSIEYPLDEPLRLPVTAEKNAQGWYAILTAAAKNQVKSAESRALGTKVA